MSTTELTPSQIGASLARIGHAKRWKSPEEKKAYFRRIGQKGGKNKRGYRKDGNIPNIDPV